MRKIDPLYIKNNNFIAVLDDYLNRFFQQNNLPDEIYENIYLAVYETLKLILSKFNTISNSNALKLEMETAVISSVYYRNPRIKTSLAAKKHLPKMHTYVTNNLEANENIIAIKASW